MAENREESWSIVPYGDGDSLVIHSGPDERVCFMATHGGSPGAWERIQANAHLVAAAPELLTSLKEISAMLFARPDMVEKLYPLMGFAEKAVFERAAAAIRKAQGDDAHG